MRLRSSAARRALSVTAGLSRTLHLGGGSTIGGRVGLAIDPHLLGDLGSGHVVALVSGTNGKTTTTRLLVEALGGPDEVASSPAGANMTAGLVTALASAPAGAPAVLEVDEGYLARADAELGPRVIVLLNLSRDQLDRVGEVRMTAQRWRESLADTDATVVANADDPLVVWASGAARRVRYVAAGGLWSADAHHCPACDAAIVPSVTGGGFSCACGFRRPDPDAELVGDELVLADGTSHAIRLAIPGRFNQANAAMAAIAAVELGVAPGEALAAMANVGEVAGRFAVVDHAGVTARLLLAKNPAGWTELLELVRHDDVPVVIAINARRADGFDPSWLWDVPFELLAGRSVVATGGRRRDLAVRLRHAGVRHVLERDVLAALSQSGAPAIDFIGNYTSFQELRRRLRAASATGVRPGQPHPRREPATLPGTASVVAERLAAAEADGRTAPTRRGRADASALRIVVVHPDLLGTYGDGGNGRILANRALWRSHPVELILAPSDRPLPAGGDLYCLGGGEDGPQLRAAQILGRGALRRAVDDGAVVLAVCAGYQVIGSTFPRLDGAAAEGVGILDVDTFRSQGRRAVGEILADSLPPHAALGRLTGFENHAGHTRLGDNAAPLARVVAGVGNGSGGEGAVAGRVFGTYLHGPVLARNPAFADVLLALLLGSDLEPLEEGEELALRAERLGAVESIGRPSLGVRRALRKVVSA